MHWVTILGMAAVTYAFRFVPLLAGGRQFPAWLTSGLAYVPVALFAALAVPGFIRPHGTIALTPEAIAGIAGAIVAWRTGGKSLPVLIVGLTAYVLARLAWQ